MKQSRPRISVENFGPIREGTVEFKPLTVLIGPNNSGKTYMATLMYALFRAFARNAFSTDWPPRFHGAFGGEYSETLRSCTPPLTVNDLPDGVREALEGMASSLISDGTENLSRNMIDAFGVLDTSQLASRVNGVARSFALSVSGFDLDRNIVELPQKSPLGAVESDRSPPPIGDLDISGVLDQSPFRARNMLLKFVWNEFLDRWGIPAGDVHYLPAGRSAILRGWEFLQSTSVAEFATAQPGVAGDFLRTLQRVLRGTGNGSNKPLAAIHNGGGQNPALFLMENDLLAGGISVADNSASQIKMRYETDGLLSVPIQQASSMAAELAPLYLWIERVLQPGDILIIDEPEAHLHPKNQRLVARVLVRLVNAGVNVICATHSSLILHQMSNHILAATKTAEKRAEIGFTDDDTLNLDDIGAYLFNLSGDDARIEPVETEDTFGISEDEFVEIAEEISAQTYDLVS